MNIGYQMFRAQNMLLSALQPERAVKKADKLFFFPRKHASKDWEHTAETQGRRMMLNNGISAIVWGEGAPVLMMHGWEGRATQMAGFVAPLNRMGFQVIALDAPAHGKSEGERSNPVKFVEAMFLAEQAFGPFYAVVGHSMGGGCALYSVSQGLSAQKVVSIAGPASFKRVSHRFAKFIGLVDAAADRFVSHVEKSVGMPFAQIDLVRRASEIEVPVLLIHDRHDEEIPFRDAQALKPVLKQGHLFETEQLGHRKIMRAGLVVDTVSSFVGQDRATFLLEAI